MAGLPRPQRMYGLAEGMLEHPPEELLQLTVTLHNPHGPFSPP